MDEKVDEKKIRPSRLKSKDAIAKLILLLLLIHLLRGIIYATVFPLWQAPDEPEHFTSIQIVAAGFDHDLPPKLMDYSGRGFSLYDYLILPFYLSLGGKSVVSVAYFIRLISVALSAITVFLTYRIAREIFPGNPYIIIGAPLFVSFLPMFTHISSTVQPDNLANAIIAFFILSAIKLIRRGINIWYLLGIPITVFIGLYTRRITFVSLPLVFILPLFLAFRQPRLNKSKNLWRLALSSGYLFFLFLAPKTIELASHKFSRANIDLEILSKMFSPSFLFQSVFSYFQPDSIFYRSFWAVFSWLNVSVSNHLYSLTFIISVISLAGITVFLLKKALNFKSDLRSEDDRTQFLSILYLLAVAFVSSYSILSFVHYIAPNQWTQGRWVYPAISAIAVIFVAGLGVHLQPKHLIAFLLAFAVNLFLFDAACLFGYIIPRFYQTLTNFSHPQNLYCGYVLPPNLYAELTSKPGFLNHNYFYYLIFLVYLALFIFFCRQIKNLDPLTKKKTF